MAGSNVKTKMAASFDASASSVDLPVKRHLLAHALLLTRRGCGREGKRGLEFRHRGFERRDLVWTWTNNMNAPISDV